MADFDRTVDVLIVGSGAAGLVAALTANDQGLSAFVVKQGEKISGVFAGRALDPEQPDQQSHRRAGLLRGGPRLCGGRDRGRQPGLVEGVQTRLPEKRPRNRLLP
jgi:aspartate oxidase